MNAGQNRTDVDFGYQFTALSISKLSSAGGTVNPGQTINYTIIVRNNTGSPQTGIAVTDPLPTGTTYVAQSTVSPVTALQITIIHSKMAYLSADLRAYSTGTALLAHGLRFKILMVLAPVQGISWL